MNMRIPGNNFSKLSPDARARIAENMRIEQCKRKLFADQAAFEAGKKPRKKPSHEEDDFQKALTIWLDLQANLLKFVWHSIPNGGRRDAKTGALLKATGAKAGVPDLFIARACHGKHGCYVELKSAKGRLSPAQEIVIEKLRADGFTVLIVRNMGDARWQIGEYLNDQTP